MSDPVQLFQCLHIDYPAPATPFFGYIHSVCVVIQQGLRLKIHEIVLSLHCGRLRGESSDERW